MFRSVLAACLASLLGGCALLQAQIHPRHQPSDATELLSAWKPGVVFQDISPYPPQPEPMAEAERTRSDEPVVPVAVIDLRFPEKLTVAQLERLIGPAPRSAVDDSRVLMFLPTSSYPDERDARAEASRLMYEAISTALATRYGPHSMASVSLRRSAQSGQDYQPVAPSVVALVVSDDLGCGRAKPCEIPLPSGAGAPSSPEVRVHRGRAPEFLGGERAWIVDFPAPEPLPTPTSWTLTDAHYLNGKYRFLRAIAAQLPKHAFLLEGRCETDCIGGPIRPPVFVNAEGGRYFVLNSPPFRLGEAPPMLQPSLAP